MGWFKNALGIFGAAKSLLTSGAPVIKGTAKDLTKSMIHFRGSLKTQMVFAGLGMLGHGSPHEKITGIVNQAALYYLTLGMGSTRQNLWMGALAASPHFSGMFRGALHGYRSVLESRTSAQIPFSHTNIAMDQAFACLQYGRSRLNDAYSSVGSEATFFASRFTSRG